MINLDQIDESQCNQLNSQTVQEIDMLKSKLNSISQNTFFDEIGPHQLVKLKQFVQCMNLNQNDYFTIEQLQKRHGADIIDVVVQYPQYTGYDIYNKQSFQTKIKMTLNEYILYQKNYENMEFLKKFRYKENISRGQILFAVNIDMEKWSEETQLLQDNLPEKIKYRSKYDALSYCKQQISGITLPQVYIKIKNCWTGGHQENLCSRSININFGPQSSQWYAIDQNQVKLLRENLKQLQNYDIIKNEGLWFVIPEQLEPFGIKPMKVIQEPGDMIIVGPGCMHWVKSQGKAIQISWNFVQKNFVDLKMMYQRSQINKKLHRENIIPFKSIYLELLNHELLQLDFMAMQFMFEKVNQFYLEEKMQMYKVKQLYLNLAYRFHNNTLCIAKKNLKKKDIPLSLTVREAMMEQRKASYCDICFTEIFNYWCICTNCNELDINICLFCYKNHIDLCRSPIEIKLFVKQKPYLFAILNRTIKRYIQLMQDGVNVYTYKELLSFCSKKLYIGQVNCCIQDENAKNQNNVQINNNEQSEINSAISFIEEQINILESYDEQVSDEIVKFQDNNQNDDDKKEQQLMQKLRLQQNLSEQNLKPQKSSLLVNEQNQLNKKNEEKLKKKVTFNLNEFNSNENNDISEDLIIESDDDNIQIDNEQNKHQNILKYQNKEIDCIEIEVKEIQNNYESQTSKINQNEINNQDLITVEIDTNIKSNQTINKDIQSEDLYNQITEEEIEFEDQKNLVIIQKNKLIL